MSLFGFGFKRKADMSDEQHEAEQKKSAEKMAADCAVLKVASGSPTGWSTVGLDTNVTTGRSPSPHICYSHPVVTLL